MNFSRKQQDVMDCLANFEIGHVEDVGTSQYCGAETGWQPFIIAHPSTLRGLEKKGYIKIVDTSWRMATIKYLKAVD